MKKYKTHPIITIDDDVIYDQDLVQSLMSAYLLNENVVSARRVHKIKYNNDGTPILYNNWFYEYKKEAFQPSLDLYATGIGGVLYPPNILDIDNITIDSIMDCLYADDVFLKKRENDLNIKVQWIKNSNTISGKPIDIDEVKNMGLALKNNLKNRNDEYIKKIGLKRIKNNRVIYTCITGNYENIVDPTYIQNDFDYICFTDNQTAKSDVWQFRQIPEELQNLSKVKQQRIIKICPHKYLSEYNESIWVDGSIDILENMDEFIRENCNEESKSVFIRKHPVRNCIYKEFDRCIELGKDSEDVINRQYLKYINDNFPRNYGLVETGIIYRKHNDSYCIQLMELWAEQIKKYSHRDQLSFNYSLWKIGDDKFQYLDANLINSKYFKLYGLHNRKSKYNEKTITSKQTTIIKYSSYDNYDNYGC